MSRPFGDPCTEALRKYLTDNSLKQSQLTGEMFADLTQRFFEHYMKKQASRKRTLSDADWLAELVADPANRGIDVVAEMTRAKFWIKQQPANAGKKFTRRFFTNWLLKADRLVGTAPVARSEPQSADPYVVPTFDWNRIVAEKWPRDEFPHREAWEEGKWSDVPLHVRKEILTIALGVTFVR